MDDKTTTARWQRPFFQVNLRNFVILVVVVVTASFYFNSPNSFGARRTGRELDIAILGRGYLQLQGNSGQFFYTRYGRLSLNDQGQFTVGRASDGWLLEPPITVPQGWTSININKNGRVAIIDESGDDVAIGSIHVALFTNDDGLREVYPNIYLASGAAGPPAFGEAGMFGSGFLHQYWLEASNKLSEVVPFVIAGALLVVTVYLAFEMQKLRSRLDDFIHQFPDRE